MENKAHVSFKLDNIYETWNPNLSGKTILNVV